MTAFQIYKKEIKRLIKKSGTGGGWNVKFLDNLDNPELQAHIRYNLKTGFVEFLYNSNEVGLTPLISARHEFAHLLTAKLEHLATERFINSDQIENESELIARILANMIS